MNKLMETQKAYLAGLIDGEGCVSVTMQPMGNLGKWERFNCKVYISNTNLGMLTAVMDMVNMGKISGVFKSATTKKLHPNWKQVYNWTLYQNEIRLFLPLIQPYLIAKTEQCKLALDFLSLVRGQGYGSHLDNMNRQKRRDIANQMKILNHRGHASI